MKIFIIHARRTAYGAIRLLKDYTKDIYVADSLKTNVFYSKYVKKGFVIKDITTVSEREFIIDLIELAKEMQYQLEKPIVYTGKDDYLIFFSKNYLLLSEYYYLSFEKNFQILKSTISKISVNSIAKSINLPIPKTYAFNLKSDAFNNLSLFPLVVKPDIKNTPEKDVVNKAFRIRICNDRNELVTAISLLNEIDVPYIIQEFIPGDDDELYTIGVYSYEGELIAWSTSKKIRQFPPTLGECSFGKTIYEDRMVPHAVNLLRSLRFTGIAQIEFKKYQNRFYLIEINPRLWSWHQINALVGVNFVKIAADKIYGKEFKEMITPDKIEKFWTFFLMDLLHNKILNNNISLYELINSICKTNIEAFFNLKDPLPFIVHLYETIKYIKKEVKS